MSQQSTESIERKAAYAARRENLRALLAQNKLDGLLITLDANRYYLSGFELKDAQPDETSGCLLIMADGKDWLCTDPRYHEAARRVWDDERIFIYRGNPATQVGEHIRKIAANKRIGFDGRHVSVEAFDSLAYPGLTRVDDLVEHLRVRKEPWEIEAIAASLAINEKMMQWVPSCLVPGKTESEIAWEIEQFFRNNGAEGLAFSTIVAVDGNAALPHADPGETKVTDNCAVLIDAGCRLNGYCSDQTRTFWVGSKPDPFFLENLRKVQEAQRKAIEFIKPGRTGAEVYEVALRSLEEEGVGQYFTHGLGHGVGLQTHERPRLAKGVEGVLEPGMVVTVEPGVYFPGRLGIRWEHMVVVTDDGYRVL